MDTFIAALPLLTILFLMIVLRWGGASAGAAGWFVAMGVAWLRFGAGLQILGLAQVKGLLLSLEVLLIMWAAFMLYRITDEAGAIAAVARVLPRLAPERRLQGVLIGWGFASFLQGVGGFGVPVAVTAPLLAGLGFSPVQAVVIPSLGHAWSVTFGSLGTAFQALVAASGVPGEALAVPAAGLLSLAAVASGLGAAHASGGRGGWGRVVAAVLVLGVIMAAGQLLLAWLGVWNLAATGGAGMGLAAAYVWLARIRPASATSQTAADEGGLLLALAAYLFLAAFVIAVEFIPPLRDWLGEIVLRLRFPELVTARGFRTPAELSRPIPIFRHPGIILLYAGLASYGLYRLAGALRPGAERRILGDTFQGLTSSSLGILSMIAMAVVMSYAGMTDALAQGLARAVGPLFPFVSVWIGALGAFMTGSNTNSNAVLAALQLRTAELLGLSGPLILAAQTAGGAVGSVIAPAKLVVGASTVRLAGEEGEILRRLLPYVTLFLTLLGALVAALLIWSA